MNFKNDTKINISFDVFTLKRPFITHLILRCIRETLKAENVPVPCEINVLVTNNAGIQSINKATRDIDRPTDVLSFPMFTLNPEEETDWECLKDVDTQLCPLGDMCISIERAQDQAKEFGHSLRREFGYLTVHSVLHLLGYDHLDEGEQKVKMRAREDAITAEIPGMQR